MVNYKYKDLFTKSHVDKQLRIATDDGLFVATNSDIHFEDFELTESLCSDSELRFGSCEASMVKFQIRNAFISLSGKWITITETLNGNTDVPFQYGRYKVFSDVPTADREYRDIIAYDAMYDILNTDVSAWYNSVLPQKDSAVTMRQFRENFVRNFGLTEIVPEGGLVNDGMTVERTIDTEQISGKDVITAICEINGCFGHIGRDGKFHYIYLPQDIQGLYPADFLFPDHVPEQWDYLSQAKTGHLYPQDPKGTRMGAGRYIKCQYEDYVVRTINRLQIRKEENDIGRIYPDPDIPVRPSDNCYVIEDNFLVYGKSSEDLAIIAENIYRKIKGVIYRPFNAECIGNPCLEVGDPLRFQTKYEIVESCVLKRKFKGIQAPRDTYEADGQEYFSEKVNGIHKSIIQIKGKANILTRTIEETKLEMYDIEKGLSNTITVTAQDIRAELKNTADGLSNTISITAGQIRTELTDTKNNLQSQITQNAGEIGLRVAKDGVVSAINLSPEKIVIQANRIDLKGLVNADELVSKFATITVLNVKTAELEELIAKKATIESLAAAEAELKNLIAKKATIESLEASNARIGNLEIDHVSISSFNAVSAEIDNIKANYITAATVKADYMEVVNWTSAGFIKADRIAANSISADKLNLNGAPASWNNLSVVTEVTVNRDSSGNVIGVNVSKNNIWFLGKNNF